MTALGGALIAVVEAITAAQSVLDPMGYLPLDRRALKHEKFLFLSGAGPYRGLAGDDRMKELAERVEEHVSTEHANWFNDKKAMSRVTPDGAKD